MIYFEILSFAIANSTMCRKERENEKNGNSNATIGVITGRKRGNCSIYIYAQNGVGTKMSVKVK